MVEMTDKMVHYLMLGVLKECYLAGMESISRGDLYNILGVDIGDDDPDELFVIDEKILEVEDEAIAAGLKNQFH